MNKTHPALQVTPGLRQAGLLACSVGTSTQGDLAPPGLMPGCAGALSVRIPPPCALATSPLSSAGAARGKARTAYAAQGAARGTSPAYSTAYTAQGGGTPGSYSAAHAARGAAGGSARGVKPAPLAWPPSCGPRTSRSFNSSLNPPPAAPSPAWVTNRLTDTLRPRTASAPGGPNPHPTDCPSDIHLRVSSTPPSAPDPEPGATDMSSDTQRVRSDQQASRSPQQTSSNTRSSRFSGGKVSPETLVHLPGAPGKRALQPAAPGQSDTEAPLPSNSDKEVPQSPTLSPTHSGSEQAPYAALRSHTTTTSEHGHAPHSPQAGQPPAFSSVLLGHAGSWETEGAVGAGSWEAEGVAPRCKAAVPSAQGAQGSLKDLQCATVARGQQSLAPAGHNAALLSVPLRRDPPPKVTDSPPTSPLPPKGTSSGAEEAAGDHVWAELAQEFPGVQQREGEMCGVVVQHPTTQKRGRHYRVPQGCKLPNAGSNKQPFSFSNTHASHGSSGVESAGSQLTLSPKQHPPTAQPSPAQLHLSLALPHPLANESHPACSTGSVQMMCHGRSPPRPWVYSTPPVSRLNPASSGSYLSLAQPDQAYAPPSLPHPPAEQQHSTQQPGSAEDLGGQRALTAGKNFWNFTLARASQQSQWGGCHYEGRQHLNTDCMYGSRALS